MKIPMLRSSLFAALMLAFSGTTGAAGLGRINVFSALGQPLRAEVEIAATPEELETMAARVAPADAFKNANIEYVGTLSAVRMSIEKRGPNGAFLKIVSDRPFSEPFVDLLIELNWAGGRLLREYTFLLDPAEAAGSKPIQEAATPVSRPSSSERRREAASAKSSAASSAPATSSAPASSDSSQYTVKSGDSLNKIAAALKPVEITQDQMVAALYRNNTDAFAGKNINRLRAGKILNVPAAEEARQIQPREARKIIIQATNFEQYRQAAASAAATKETPEGQSSSGKIASKVEEAAPQQEAKDRVKVTSTKLAKGGEASSGSKSNTSVQALQDELVSRDKALKEANSRVADLEKNVKELQKLVELKSQGLAEAQAQAGSADAAAKEAKARAEELEKSKAAAAQSPVVAAPPAETGDVSAPAGSSDSEVATAPAVQSAPPEVKGLAAPKPAASVAAPVPVEEDSIFTNPLAWAGIAVAALGAAYVVIKQRRRSHVAATTQMTEAATTTSQNSVFGNAGGQTVDTGGTSLLHTDFSQSGLSAIDTDEGVDPVAEADVYMAYGRDAQAEEILLDALKNDPSRGAIYLKLLEIYAQRRSLKQFENVASDLYTQTGGVGPDWEKAVALGARLDPENSLYRTAGTANVASAAPTAVAAGLGAVAGAAATVEEKKSSTEDLGSFPDVNLGASNVPEMLDTWTTPTEIGQLSGAEDTGVPTLENPETTIGTESLNLDFNLDLELNESEEPPTQIEVPETFAPTVPAAASAQQEVKTSAPPEATSELQDTSGLMPLEFDLGIEEDRAPAVQTQAPRAPSVSPEQSAPSPAEDDVDVGIQMAHEEAESVVDLEKTNFEGSLLDFDFELGEEPSKPTLDLSAVNLGGQQRAPETNVGAAPQEAAIPDNIDVDEEISTKLELAQAYEEMGDAEGARELLEEVIADGAPTQQQAARSILARLG